MKTSHSSGLLILAAVAITQPNASYAQAEFISDPKIRAEFLEAQANCHNRSLPPAVSSSACDIAVAIAKAEADIATAKATTAIQRRLLENLQAPRR